MILWLTVLMFWLTDAQFGLWGLWFWSPVWFSLNDENILIAVRERFPYKFPLCVTALGLYVWHVLYPVQKHTDKWHKSQYQNTLVYRSSQFSNLLSLEAVDNCREILFFPAELCRKWKNGQEVGNQNNDWCNRTEGKVTQDTINVSFVPPIPSC